MNNGTISPSAQMTVYCILVALASLAGGWILLLMRLTDLRLQMAGSFVAGLMLSMALLHFIPHATRQNHSLDQTVRYVLAGFLAMFLLQRFFPHHHHDVSEGAPERRGSPLETDGSLTLAVVPPVRWARAWRYNVNDSFCNGPRWAPLHLDRGWKLEAVWG